MALNVNVVKAFNTCTQQQQQQQQQHSYNATTHLPRSQSSHQSLLEEQN